MCLKTGRGLSCEGLEGLNEGHGEVQMSGWVGGSLLAE